MERAKPGYQERLKKEWDEAAALAAEAAEKKLQGQHESLIPAFDPREPLNIASRVAFKVGRRRRRRRL